MKLVFVYNVNSDPVSLLLDGAHKVFSPSTYDCDLCAITYSNLGERKAWKTYRKKHRMSFEFIYKNQMIERYGLSDNCPLILKVETGTSPEVFVSRDEFKRITTPAELISLIDKKLGNGSAELA